MAKGFLDGCIWQAQSEGLGDFAFTEALESFFSPTEAGAVDGTTYNYTAYKGASREAGWGAWNESTGTLTRNPVISTNSNNLVNFADPPVVIMGGPLARDMRPVLLTAVDITADGPFTTVDIPVDFSRFAFIELTTYDVRADVNNLDTDDLIQGIYCDVIGSGPTTILAGDPSNSEFVVGEYYAESSGGAINETRLPLCATNISIAGQTASSQLKIANLASFIDDSFDAEGSFNLFNEGLFCRGMSANETNVTLSLYMLQVDASDGFNFVPTNMIMGKIEVWGYPRSV